MSCTVVDIYIYIYIYIDVDIDIVVALLQQNLGLIDAFRRLLQK